MAAPEPVKGLSFSGEKAARQAAARIDSCGTGDVNSPLAGAVAQMGERCNRTAEVVSSNLISSTSRFRITNQSWK
jgi:hypothetical protein